jgi:phospholipase/lecithinase/hemolysin
VTVYAIDSWSLFTDVFDNPEKYGFTAKDVNRAYGGKMWMDGLHPKSAFHEIIADTVLTKLAA